MREITGGKAEKEVRGKKAAQIEWCRGESVGNAKLRIWCSNRFRPASHKYSPNNIWVNTYLKYVCSLRSKFYLKEYSFHFGAG